MEVVQLLNSERHTLPKISVDKRAMIGLWYLANIESFRCLSQRFGVSESTAHECVYDLIRSLCNNRYKFIKFPTTQNEFESLANKFYKYGYPNVCGAIDGTSIDVTPPQENKNDFFTRKYKCSINMTAVCDGEKRYMSIFVGYSGRCHDNHIFTMSPLYKKITQNKIPTQYHIIGDAAYGLHLNIMSPYVPRNTPLTIAQSIHNNRLSSTRMVIERSFGDLKGRWRRLRFLECRIENACAFVTACAVLHNICLNNGDYYDADKDTFLRQTTEPSYNCDVILPTTNASTKRDFITQHLLVQ